MTGWSSAPTRSSASRSSAPARGSATGASVTSSCGHELPGGGLLGSVDPSLVDVLRILGFDREYASASGSYLYDLDGRAYLDLHTGEGFASLGHNHPDVRDTLRAALSGDLVDGVQIHYSVLAGIEDAYGLSLLGGAATANPIPVP